MSFNLIPWTDQQKLAVEAKEYEVSRNMRSQEELRGHVMDQIDAAQPLDDDEEGFLEFQKLRHANDTEDDVAGLSFSRIAAKIAEQEAADRQAWEEFKARPDVAFMRQHPEVSESDVQQIDLQLAEWRIKTPSLSQLNQAYAAVKNHGLSRPIRAQKVESEQSAYDMPMEELARRAGGLTTNGRTAPEEYVPSNLGSRHFGVGTTHEPGEIEE